MILTVMTVIMKQVTTQKMTMEAISMTMSFMR